MALCLQSWPEIVPARSLVIVAGGGRDLAWPHQRVAAELLARSSCRLVHLLLHGGARGADAAIGQAAHQLGWPSLVMPAQWQRHGRAAAVGDAGEVDPPAAPDVSGGWQLDLGRS